MCILYIYITFMLYYIYIYIINLAFYPEVVSCSTLLSITSKAKSTHWNIQHYQKATAQSLLGNIISCKDIYYLNSSDSQRKFLQPPPTTACSSNPRSGTALARVDLVLFTGAGIELIVLEIVLIIERCFCYCWEWLTQRPRPFPLLTPHC